MGCDKADLAFGGLSFLDLQIQKGVQLGIRDILISGYRKPRSDLHIVKDHLFEKGPLGGLEASLRAAKHPRCLVLSVDTPLVPAEELQHLLETNRQSDSPITILKNTGKEQPLIGVYDRSLADAMVQEIQAFSGSVFAFLHRVGYEVYESPAPSKYFANINTPEEYRAALLCD